MDILQTVGEATLATTTVVLGASMFPQNKSSQTVDQQVTSGMPLVNLGWFETMFRVCRVLKKQWLCVSGVPL